MAAIKKRNNLVNTCDIMEAPSTGRPEISRCDPTLFPQSRLARTLPPQGAWGIRPSIILLEDKVCNRLISDRVNQRPGATDNTHYRPRFRSARTGRGACHSIFSPSRLLPSESTITICHTLRTDAGVITSWSRSKRRARSRVIILGDRCPVECPRSARYSLVGGENRAQRRASAGTFPIPVHSGPAG
jgi:hypothetical protein